MQTAWSECWGNNKIGSGLLLNGDYSGYATYTNTKGVRNRYLEFIAPIFAMKKAAGILTRLENGIPVVGGQSSLDGVNVEDIVGWARALDALVTPTNVCTVETFSGFTLVPNAGTSGLENHVALKQLLDGEVDKLMPFGSASILNLRSNTSTAP